MLTTFQYAITRRPGKTFDRGITTSNLGAPDYELILKQHTVYIETLKSIGIDVIELDPLPDYPDAHFVEDTVVVTPDVAIITNPGAPSRQGEEKSITEVILRYRQVEYIQAPGTVDGGDVLMMDNHFFIGISERTNHQGADQMGKILEKHDNTFTPIPVGAGLHFKSSVNCVAPNTLLITGDVADHEAFYEYDKIMVGNEESYAANTLWINNHLLMPKGFPSTKAKLKRLGLPIIELDVSEIQKMDGGLTCLSIRF
jgi:dimethylargininase